MNIGKATAIFKRINDNDIPDSDKITAIGEVLDMPTHNSITKGQILQVLWWLWRANYKDVKECIEGITLLSKAEHENYCHNIKPIDGWWWLRSPGFLGNYTACVNRHGVVDEIGYDVDLTGGSVRPALVLKGSPEIGQSFTFGGEAWTVISDTLALADEPFCKMAFQTDWERPGANEYKNSDIKPYLDCWLAAQGTL